MARKPASKKLRALAPRRRETDVGFEFTRGFHSEFIKHISEKFPSLQNEEHAKHYAEIQVSPHFSRTEKTLAEILFLKEIYPKLSSADRKLALQNIRFLTHTLESSGQSLTEPARRKKH